MSKVAYEALPGDVGGWYYNRLSLTGRCKTEYGGPYNAENGTRYYEHQVKFLGIKLWKRWVCEKNIRFFDEKRIEYTYEKHSDV